MRMLKLVLLGGFLASFGTSGAAANECTQPSQPIETDRPDVTNSSIVVPFGSLQNENGINVNRSDAADILDGTNSRWRLGIAPCLEVLVDLPNYFTTFHGNGASGFGDVAPGVKWQLNLPQSTFDLSVTAGAALPTGANAVSGPGVQPYLQIPWSLDLGNGWALTGMETNFFAPASAAKFTYQSTFVVEKEIAERPLSSSNTSAAFRRAAPTANCSIPVPVIASTTITRSTFTPGSVLITMRRLISSASAIHSGSTASSDVWSSSKNLSLDRLQALIRPQ